MSMAAAQDRELLAVERCLGAGRAQPRPSRSLDEDHASALAAVLSEAARVRVGEPLAPRTTLRVGGPADLYVEPAHQEDLAAVLDFCRERCLRWFVLGRGSNLVVREGGYRGVVICLAQGAFGGIACEGARLRVGAGARLKAVAAAARQQCLAGFEFLDGIPGTVGGALRMNAGAMGTWILDITERIRIMDRSGCVREIEAAGLPAGYRGCSALAGHVVLAAVLRGEPSSIEAIQSRSESFSTRRRETQPRQPSAGCVFKNPASVAAGRLIEELGLKGERVGGAQVSSLHGNFIVNAGGATARDVLALVERIRDRARVERGIDLETEVEIVGEDKSVVTASQRMVEPLRITVMRGGPSAEREISLRSGDAVARALRELGHQVEELDPRDDAWQLPGQTDLVFLALHGTYGEDGTVQRRLEALGVPYTGSDPEGSRVAFDKVLTKQRCLASGVATPRYTVLRAPGATWPPGWQPPVVLKPVRQGSSVGLRLVERGEDLLPGLAESLRYDHEVLMEERIVGSEVTVGILDDEALPIIEVCPKQGLLDYHNKYTKGATEHILPARFDGPTSARIQAAALAVFRAIGGRDYARVDLIVTAGGEPVVLEVNTLPGMTELSLLPRAAAAVGYSFSGLCQKMVDLAWRRARVPMES